MLMWSQLLSQVVYDQKKSLYFNVHQEMIDFVLPVDWKAKQWIHKPIYPQTYLKIN